MRGYELRLLTAVLGLLLAMSLMRTGLGAELDLLDAVRDDTVQAVQTLLASGADPNARDETGATALMHAAALSSIETIEALLDRGADVNASSGAGATALMWATGDARRVRLLLDHGATVNARTPEGTTALVTAARRGNFDVMRLLLARGGDPTTAANETTELLRIAYGDYPAIRQVLAEAGIELTQLVPAGAAPLATFPTVSNAEVVRDLLDMGVSPNPRGRFPILANAVFEGHLGAARVLLEGGADPNAKGQQGVTPLMMAAAATRPDLAMVQLLLENGAAIDPLDDAGRSALDWAMLQGDTPVAKALRDAGASATAPSRAVASPISRPRTPRDAVTEALARLNPGGPVFYERTNCISCHHQALPLIATALAKARGVAVDTDAIAHPVRAISEVWNGRRENLMLARSRDGGGANELTYGLLAFAEAGVQRSSLTDTAVANLVSTQRADGSWVFLDTRAPQADNSRIPFTAMAIRALSVYGPPGLRTQIESSTDRALTFLRQAEPQSTQDEAFKLLGLVWSKRPAREIAAQARRVKALQREDGGWAQLSTMRSDAYATGQALHALNAAGISRRDKLYGQGVEYLLRTQLEDGSWFVRSRAFGFQRYFETGFPHGVDQFISASATAWAVIALAHAL
jgi:ankyrin repeat protein